MALVEIDSPINEMDSIKDLFGIYAGYIVTGSPNAIAGGIDLILDQHRHNSPIFVMHGDNCAIVLLHNEPVHRFKPPAKNYQWDKGLCDVFPAEEDAERFIAHHTVLLARPIDKDLFRRGQAPNFGVLEM